MHAEADDAVAGASSLITVDAALRLPALRRGAPEVLAGREHLHRPIRWVHAAEISTIATSFKGGELLLTIGMGVGKVASQQRRFIDQLAEREVAAVVIELGQLFRQVPPALIDRASARGLPLIALHREIPFIEVTEAIHGHILGRQLAALRRGEDIHRRFTELMLEGSGIPEILSTLAHEIANPVLLEKSNHGILYHATHRSSAPDVLGAWQAMSHDDQSRASDASDGAIVMPVRTTGGATWGRLVALSIDSTLDEFARVAVERAVPLVALTLLRSHQEEVLSTRERGNFLADIAADRLDPADAAQRAQILGFEPRASDLLLPLAIATSFSTAAHTKNDDDTAWAPVWRVLLNEMRSRAIPILVGARTSHGDALVLLTLPTPDRRRAYIELAATVLHAAAKRHLKTIEAPVIAAGRAVTSWRELPEALREVADTAELARAASPRPWHDAATPDVDRLLLKLRTDPDLRQFVHHRLQPLIDHDRRRASKLLPTLQALLEHQGRKAETARALHLERQSLYHRIQRIQGLLDADLDDPDTRLGLHLAVRAHGHLETDGS